MRPEKKHSSLFFSYLLTLRSLSLSHLRECYITLAWANNYDCNAKQYILHHHLYICHCNLESKEEKKTDEKGVMRLQHPSFRPLHTVNATSKPFQASSLLRSPTSLPGMCSLKAKKFASFFQWIFFSSRKYISGWVPNSTNKYERIHELAWLTEF